MARIFAPTDTLNLTNLTKVFWPEHGYTKRDLIDYYREIAPVILPYVIDRPQVLHRHVDGHAGKEFFQRLSRLAMSFLRQWLRKDNKLMAVVFTKEIARLSQRKIHRLTHSRIIVIIRNPLYGVWRNPGLILRRPHRSTCFPIW